MFKEHNVKKLPDAYRKDKDSNNYKLLRNWTARQPKN